MTTDHAIVLSRTKYGDSGLILNAYSQSHGKRSYFIRGAHKRGSRSQKVLLQPLSLIRFSVNYKSTKGLPHPKQIESVLPLFSISQDPVKQTVAMFTAELLAQCLTEQLKDAELFEWLVAKIASLENSSEISLFPHTLLNELTVHLGFTPDDSPGECFDLENGCFVAKEESNQNSLQPEESEVFYQLITEKFKEPLNAAQKHQLLNNLLKYYEYHIDGINGLKSLEVIRAVYYS